MLHARYLHSIGIDKCNAPLVTRAVEIRAIEIGLVVNGLVVIRTIIVEFAEAIRIRYESELADSMVPASLQEFMPQLATSLMIDQSAN